MRAFMLPLIVALIAAGCVGATGDAGPVADAAPPTAERILPEMIDDSRTASGLETESFGQGPPLCTRPSSRCVRHPFELSTTATLDAKLTWGLSASDFDLHVFQDGVSITGDGASQPPGTEEVILIELEPGSYELVVVPWAVTQDTYKLVATFS